uniref:Protein kinase domain-containing protein n=1 Tax=Chlamydomonas leiostraca TaxID=1034604 RepID=A0A7S0RFW1_9CHLO|mmetsp:Transcript_21702/g.55264  ORF Transcript_21702/g.55264 Transcript_21702/m.55264 type:complete len:576 (+) Transcript_21702:114-1841(+)
MPPTVHAKYGVEQPVQFVIKGGAVNLKNIRDWFQLSRALLDDVCYPEDSDGWSEGSDFKDGDTVTVTGAAIASAAAAQPQPGMPDTSRVQVAWLVPPNETTVPIEVISSPSALAAYLANPGARRIPVTAQFYSAAYYNDSVLAESKLVSADGSALPVLLSSLLQKEPSDCGSELTTSIAMHAFLDGVLGSLAQYSDVQLLFKISLNKAEGSTSSSVTKPRTRPDALLLSGNCTLLIGEDKQEGGMLGALKDVMGKFSGLSAIHYGPVGHILAYTAAGLQVQLHTVSLGQQQTQITHVTPVLDLKKPHHRMAFVLILAKVYLVLHRMAASLPELLHRFPLFKPLSTHSHTTLIFTPGQVTKHIACFGQFAAEHHTSFKELQAAYSAAETAGRAAAASSRPPWLASACDGPKLNASKDMYKVGLQPVGYRAAPTNEHELRGVALACCSGLAALHAATPPLVHRDIRQPNVVRLAGGAWLLIDLEQAAYAARLLPAGYRLSDWDDHTLERAQQQASQVGQQEASMLYTPLSDMYQLGKMLRGYGVAGLSPAASAFSAALIAKQLTAQDALQHPWLQQQ